DLNSAIEKKKREIKRLNEEIQKIEQDIKHEQNEFSNFLLAIDKKISSIQKEINKLEDFKRGLLQSLFVKIIERIKNIFLYVRLIIN
ncbi:MAG: hypothetical protein UHX91_01270, partial [Methanosphaera sp.]|nr:hypothetical protein [Methanosphaera sp.]